jgi:hypothetical protein
VTVFRCRRCGAALTVELREAVAPPAPAEGAWVERGCFARDPDPFGPPFVPVDLREPRYLTSAGTRGTLLVHLADAVFVRHVTDALRMSGCCGPSGTDGPNRLCTCDAEIGTEQSDCWTPHVLRLEPGAVVATDT